MDYIHKTLGLKCTRTRWNGQSKLPYYLLNEYSYEVVRIGNQNCIFLTPKNRLAAVATIRKHLKQLKEHIDYPAVLKLTELTRQRKESFIIAKIPFVVPGKQLYLPFIGVVLNERNTPETADNDVDKLMPSAQMLLFIFLLGRNKPLYLSEVSKQLHITAMSISRAANQLVQLGLVEHKKDGVRKYILSETTPSELFKRTKPWCVNPVRKMVYIDRNEVQADMFPAGLTALSAVSMLNPPSLLTYGTAKNEKNYGSVSTELVDSESSVALQIWRYDPRQISLNNQADALSLYMSFTGNQDERIDQALEEFLDRVL